MIATLTGEVGEKLGGQVVLDVGGVGYGVLVAAEDFGRLAPGTRAKLYIYEHIREQAHDLFGFAEPDAKALFEQLLSVNGVGPKMALNVLSIGSNREVRQAIAGGDAKFIQAAPGVGKRVAERIVVELKDKLDFAGLERLTPLSQVGAPQLGDEAAEALVALGYSPADAVAALQGVDSQLPVEARVKRALQGGRA